jgi:hypothetical protein
VNTQTQLHLLEELQLALDYAQTTSPPLEKQTKLAKVFIYLLMRKAVAAN